MANLTPHYFLPSTWDIPSPPAGPLHLGTIITSLKNPDLTLFTPPPSTSLNPFTTTQNQVSFSTSKLLTGQLTLFTRFLSFVLGAGVDASVSWEGKNAIHLTIPTLTTHTIQLTPEYLASAISSPQVQRFLAKSRYSKPLYIITGLKIARGGASAASVSGKTIGVSLAAEVDATVFSGVPVAAGPEVGVAKGGKMDVSWEGGSDFVFAFRVRKVVVGRTGVVKREEEYTKGAMLGCEEERMQGDGWRVLSEEEERGENEGFEAVELGLEDGESDVFAFPTELDDLEV